MENVPVINNTDIPLQKRYGNNNITNDMTFQEIMDDLMECCSPIIAVNKEDEEVKINGFGNTSVINTGNLSTKTHRAKQVLADEVKISKTIERSNNTCFILLVCVILLFLSFI
jgi:hypothetical protein